MKKKFLNLSIVLIIALIAIVSCFLLKRHDTQKSSDGSSSEVRKDFDLNKENYSRPDYDLWNHNKLKDDTKVKISGEVVQAMYDDEDGESDGGAAFRVAMDNDYDKIVYVYIDDINYKKTISEDDIVTFYGYSYGRYTYESALGGDITIPYMDGVMYELYEDPNFESKKLYDQNGLVLEQTNFDTFKLENNTNNSIKVEVDSIDVDGQVLSSYALNDFEYKTVDSGQWIEASLEDNDGVMKEGKNISFTLSIENEDYDVIDTISANVTLSKDILN